MRTSEEIMRTDAESRRRIREDIDTNFFVEAAAGSGKTSSLVDRMVAMVKAGKDIRKITAITFTVNAANEFYSRFRTELQKAADSSELDGEVSRKCRDALDNIDLCFMGTIDSFCEMVCAEHPYEAGIPADAHVAEENELEAIYRRELAKVQNGDYGAEITEKYRNMAKYLYQPEMKVLDAIGSFMDTRDCQRVYNPYNPKALDEEYADVKSVLAKAVEIAAADGGCLYTDSKAACVAAEEFLNSGYVFSEKLEENPSQVLRAVKQMKDLRFREDPMSLGVPENTIFRFYDGRGRYKWYETVFDPGSRLESLVNNINELKYSAVMEFMDSFAEILGELLKKQGKLGFFDYQLCLRDMLRRDAQNGGKLAKHIYSRHSFFLIDEFQDTAPIQAETFFRLSAEKPEKDWRDCIPVPGSLFIVGDPKQSIYRFRGADVSSYLNVRSLFRNGVGDVLHLYRNFRSTDTMCREFNDVFSRLLPEENVYQSAFESIPIAGDSGEEEISGIYEYSTSDKSTECSADIVRLIRTLTGSFDCRIKIKGKKTELRPIQYRDIMVITAGKKELSEYMKACIEAQIPVSVEGKTVFADCTALKMISSVMDAVSDPANAMKVYAALMCGLFDLDDMELSRYCLDDFSLKLKMSVMDSDGSHDRVICAMNSLAPLVVLAANAAPVTLFNRIFRELPVIKKSGTDNLEYVYYASELLADAEMTGKVSSAAEAALFVSELVNNKSGLERTMYLNREPNCVHIANLHKVKGLESPVVILAASKSRNKPPIGRTQRDGNESARYEFQIEDADYFTICKTEAFPEQMETEKLFNSAEKDRLIYVAGTRAGNILIVPSLSKNDSNFWKAFLQNSSGDIYDVFTDEAPERQRELFDAAQAIEETSGSTVLPNDAAGEKTYAIKRPSSLDGDKVRGKKAEDSAEPDDRTVQASDTEKPGRSDAGLIGTMVHRIMEILVTSKNRVGEDEAVAAVLGEYEFSPERGTEYEEMLRHVVNIMRNGGYGQTTDVCRDVLGELLSADEVYCEVPICLKEGTDIVHGFIDVIYRNDSEWHILDYKTDALTEGIAERHASQLAAYVKAFGELTGEKADAKIYHIEVKG